MREIRGKLIYESLEEVVEPAHTALLVIDMQNDFCTESGARHRGGKNIQAGRDMIPDLLRVIGEAQEHGVFTVYLQNTRLSDGRSDSAASLAGNLKRLGTPDFDPYTVEGSWGQELIAELQPRPQDIVLKKFRSSGFHQTMLDQVLKTAGVETVVLTGVTTEGCVMATWRDAGFHDYYTVLVEDCVATYTQDLHEAALKIMRQGQVVSADDVLTAWKVGTRVMQAHRS